MTREERNGGEKIDATFKPKSESLHWHTCEPVPRTKSGRKVYVESYERDNVEVGER